MYGTRPARVVRRVIHSEFKALILVVIIRILRLMNVVITIHHHNNA